MTQHESGPGPRRAMAPRMQERSAVILVLMLLVPAALVVGWRYYSRPPPFDSVRWRTGDAVVRYRMKDALLAKHAAGELATRDAVDAALGPNDEAGDTPQDRYLRLQAPGLPTPGTCGSASGERRGCPIPRVGGLKLEVGRLRVSL